MEYKIFRVRLGTWRKLRGLFPGKPGETVDAYIQRITREVRANGMENNKE